MIERSRPAVVGGVVLAAGLLWWTLELAALRVDPAAFHRMQSASASLPGRLVAGAVLLAAVVHAFDGVRTTFWPGGGEPARWPEAQAFLTWALVLPGWVVLLRPFIEDLLR